MSRLAVVTGGGKGIGLAITRRLMNQGDAVLALGRDAAALGACGAEHAVCDVADEAAVRRVLGRLPQVDVLVNCAGVSSSSPLARTSAEAWHEHMAINATGVFLCTRAVVGGMLARGSGRIVTVASTAGLRGAPYIAAYAASKHAAIGLTRAVAAEVAGSGVTANAVCPAFVRTEMTERSVARIVARTGRSADEAEAALAAQTRLGRLLEPEEVAAAVAFLASPEAGAINGQALVLDGGGTP